MLRPLLMNFPGAIFESELAVRPDDLDLFQHVHSTRYLDYVLAARFDQMKRCYRMGMEELLKQGLGWVVRRSFIDYQRPLKMGDHMIVRTRIEEIFKNGVKVWFEILHLPERKKVAPAGVSIPWSPCRMAGRLPCQKPFVRSTQSRSPYRCLRPAGESDARARSPVDVDPRLPVPEFE